MADQVADLITVAKMKLHGYKYSFSDGDSDIIRALNAAQHTLWLLLVASGRNFDGGGGNWFVKKTQLVFAGVRDQALPNDFHDLALLECTTPGWEGVQFKASGLFKQVFQENRRKAGTVDATEDARYFVIVGNRGTQPATLMLDRIPNVAISLDLWYTATATDWSSPSDDISYWPLPYRDPLVNYAVTQLIASDQDPAIVALWQSLWAEHKAFVQALGMKRQILDVVSAQPYDRSG
jgi:hypothetical protein